jgi:hypothetical protein
MPRPIPRDIDRAAQIIACAAVCRRIHVHTAWQEDAIQTLEHRSQRVIIRQQRNQHRSRTNRCQRGDVPLIHDPRVRQVCRNVVDRLQRLGRHADDRARMRLYVHLCRFPFKVFVRPTI